MSDGFQVIMTDLQQAAGVFRTEAGTFAAIMPATGPVSVDGGGAEINDALSLVLAAIGGLHTQLAAVIGGHADKLETAYGTYRDAEDAIIEMSEAIAPARRSG
jgi:hypothetical protein